MAKVLDSNSESGFVFASMMEFMKAWESGSNSRLFLESFNGSAYVSFGCFLGQPSEKHVKPKKKEKSKKKQERDNMRAANFQAAMKSNDDDDVKTTEDDNDDDVKTTADDNDETIELSDENFDTTRDEDYEDYTEEAIPCTVDVWDHRETPSEVDFENEIVPEMKTTAVQYVLEQENVCAFPSEDFHIHEVKWEHRSTYKNASIYRCRILYRQKLKKTKEPFADAFRRHCDMSKKFVTKNGLVFRFMT